MTNISVPAGQVRAAKTAAGEGPDLRLDLFRGLANWAIFLDHIPNNAVAWLTTMALATPPICLSSFPATPRPWPTPKPCAMTAFGQVQSS